MTIDWKPIKDAPQQEPLVVTSEHFPGWFAIGWRSVLGEWHVENGCDRLPHHPTHFERLNAVEKRSMS